MIDYQPLQEVIGTDQLTLEAAQALKKETRAQRNGTNKDLEALMHQYQRTAKEQYYENLKGMDRWVASFKEFIGRGREYTYKQHLRELATMSAQLNTMAENTSKLTSEYRTKMQENRGAVYEDRKVFELNAVIYTEKQKVLSQRREELLTLEKQSVLGTSCTTEAMRLHKDILDLESDVIDLNHENDQLAIDLTVKTSVLETQHQTYANLQDLHGNVQRQRSVFNAHYELAQAQERIMAGVKGVHNAKDLYMRSAVLVQQLKTLQDQLGKRGIDDLPQEFMLGTPKLATKRDPTRPYWMTVAEQIRKPLYNV